MLSPVHDVHLRVRDRLLMQVQILRSFCIGEFLAIIRPQKMGGGEGVESGL